MIYLSYVRPILEYCDIVWDSCGVYNSTSLEKLQRRAARIAMNISNSDEAMDKMKWSTLQNRRESHIFKFVKKCIKSHCPQFFKNYFTFNKVIHNRRLGKATCFICQETLLLL